MPSTSSAPPELRGRQQPRLLLSPDFTSSSGSEAVELAELAGLHLDPWQQLCLHYMCAETLIGKWAAFEFGLIVARQGGKGAVLEARQLAGLFLFGDREQVHSAHLFATSKKHFERIASLVEGTASLMSKVRRISNTNGDEGIRTKAGCSLDFRARTSRGAGRGLSGDILYLDEAMYLPDTAMSNLVPILGAKPNPQIVYTATPVDKLEHPDGHTLAAVRRRALAGIARPERADPTLAWMEWSVDPGAAKRPEDVDPDDQDAWCQAMPSLGYRATRAKMISMQRAMTRRAFAVEELCVGDWPEEESREHVITPATWAARTDVDSSPTDPVVIAVDVRPDRSRAAIGVAGRRPDGRVHVELAEHGDGVDWVVPRLAQIVRAWDPAVLVIDPGGATGTLLPALAAAELESMPMGPKDVATACAIFYDDVVNDRLRHLGDPILAQALDGAKKRTLSGAWAWTSQLGADITPLVAVTNALWALTVHVGIRVDTPATPLALDPGPTTGSELDDFDAMAIGF